MLNSLDGNHPPYRKDSMPACKIEAALKDVIEERLTMLREEMACCAREGLPTGALAEQINMIERLRESHQGKPRIRIF